MLRRSSRVPRSRWPFLPTLALALGSVAPFPASAQPTCELYVTDGVVRALAVSGNTLYIGGGFSQVGPATGHAVPISAQTGVPLSFPKVNGVVHAVASDGAGGWIVGGTFDHVAGVPRANIARLNADGTLAAWNPGVNGDVRALVLSGGIVYAGGSFSQVDGQSRRCVAAIDVASGDVTAWTPNTGLTLPLFVNCLAVGGGNVYVGGHYSGLSGPQYALGLSVSTGAMTAWDPDPDGEVRAIAVSNGVVYLAGPFSEVAGESRPDIAAVDGTTGSLIAAWNAGPTSTVHGIVVDGGLVYTAGFFGSIGGQARNNLAALSATTGLATAWNPNVTGQVTCVAVNSGVVYVGGTFTAVGGAQRNRLAAISAADGTAPTGWNPNANSTVNAIAAAGNAVMAGGWFTSIGSVPRSNLAALDIPSGAVTLWNPHVDDTVRALAADAGSVYVGGEFFYVGGLGRPRIAKIDAASGITAPWSGSGGVVNALVLDGNTLYVGGTFPIINGADRQSFAALDATTGTPSFDFNTWVDGTVLALALWQDRLYLGGSFVSLLSPGGTFARTNIAAVDAQYGGVLNFGAQPNGPVHAIVANPFGVFIGGAFTTVNSAPHNFVARLEPQFGSVMNWNGHTNGLVRALAMDPTGAGSLYAGGEFTTVNGQGFNRLAALDRSTGLPVASWNPNANGVVRALLATATGRVFAGGDFTSLTGRPLTRLACLVAPGWLDAPPSGGFEGTGDIAWARTAPNPSAGDVTIEYGLAQASHVRVAVYDTQGRAVARLADAAQPGGPHVVTWALPRRALGAGIYYVRIETATGRVTRPIVRLP